MAQQTASFSGSSQRFVFFDNLRFIFVVGVVLQHAGMAYSWSDWWPVTDGSSILAAGLVGFFDGFLMPSLFFIAGYFAIPSIRKKSISAFIKGKFKRLGIPWLVCTLFIGPVLPLIYHYTRSGLRLTTGYLETWISLMGNALQLDIGILPPMKHLMQNDLFYQRYMWFISLLIVFFLVFALVYRLRPEWFNIVAPQLAGQTGIGSTLKLFFMIGMVTFVGSTILIGFMFMTVSGVSNPESWFTLGNLVQFRVSRIFLHAAYFIIGILAFKRGWVQSGRFPGHQATWTISFILSFFAYYASMFLIKSVSGDHEKLLGMVFWLFLNFFTISALGLSSSLAYKYWNRQTPLNRNLTANSYNLYLAHYIFVLGFQLLLVQFFQIPVIFKYVLVSAGAVYCGYLVSRFLIKPHPWLTIAAATIGFTGMITFIHP